MLPASFFIGLIVLHQVPTVRDLAGIALVIAGVAMHCDADVGGAARSSGPGPSGSRRKRDVAA